MHPDRRRAGRAIRKRRRTYRNLGRSILLMGDTFKRVGYQARISTRTIARLIEQQTGENQT